MLGNLDDIINFSDNILETKELKEYFFAILPLLLVTQ